MFIVLAAVIVIIIIIIHRRSEKMEEKALEEHRKRMVTGEKRMCDNGQCSVCSRKINNEIAHYVLSSVFYTAKEYEGLCWDCYTRVDASKESCEYYCSFTDWKILMRDVMTLSNEDSYETLCSHCYMRKK